MKRAFIVALCCLLVGAALASADGNAINPTGKKYKIALSNSYMGNDWRQIMERVVEFVATQSPYKERVDLRIVNTDNTPEAQSASIDALAKQGYDAILVDSSSPAALNPSIERAAKAGIVVVSFDQVVTARSAWKIESDYISKAELSALYIAKVLNGEGNVIVDRGLPGATMSRGEYEAVKKLFAKYPKIKIVAEYDGKYDPGPSEQGVASALAASPKVDAVWTQGPMTAVVKAFKAAGRQVPVITGGGYGVYNGDALNMLDNNYKCLVWLFDMPGLSAVAMKTAINILDKKDIPDKNMKVRDTFFASNDTSIDIGAPIQKLEEGKNCWRDRPPAFGWPVLPIDFGITVQPEDVYPKN